MWPAPSLKALHEQMNEAYRDNRLAQCLELEEKIHRAQRREKVMFAVAVTSLWVASLSFTTFVVIRILQ